MKAIIVKAPGGPQVLEYVDMPTPEVGPHELLIKVSSAGVCSHDIAMRKGILKRGVSLPFIPGHEVSGIVERVGSAVTRFAPNDRVATTQRRRVCGICDYCCAGEETYCERLVFLGHGLACGGGYAEYVSVGEECACKVPDGVSMADASIASCALGTSLNAVRDVGEIQIGETVLVTGAGGGLGIHALQFARLCGARVLAVTSNASKTAVLSAAGAHEVIVYERGSDFSGQVRSITDGRGVNVVLDNVGTAVFQSCRRSLAKRGRWILVGELAGEFVAFNPAQLVLNGTSMHSVHSSTRAHLQDCLTLLSRRSVRAFIDQQLPLARAEEAHALVETGLVSGRTVLVP